MLKIGDRAPDFTLTTHNGEEVNLSDFTGKKVVLYFYPKADTPGCTKQACAVSENWSDITAGEVVVLGISPDEPEDLTKFREKHDITFPLLSDPDHEVAEAYDAWGEKKMFGKTSEGIIRSHFAVNEEGLLIEAAYKVKPESTAELAQKLAQD